MNYRQRINSKTAAILLCVSAGSAYAGSLCGCSSSKSPNSASGAAGNANTGGGLAATGGNPNTGTGGTPSTGTGGTVNAAGCTSVQVSASTGIWPVINVELVPAKDANAAYTQLIGFPWNGPPVPELLAKTAESGSCQLLKVVAATCSPLACNAAAVACVGTTWFTRPVLAAIGNLTFTGLTLEAGGTNFTLSAIANMYQAAGSTAVAYPPCTVGADVTVAAGAGTANAFSLKASCIAPLTVTSAQPLPFERLKAAQFTWAPATAGNSRVSIEIDISHHAGLKGLIRCEVPDTGSATVDASLVTSLIDYGTAGFPDASLTRHSVASVAVGSGTATLDVKSTTSIPLQIPGVVSCNDTMPCPTGQSCISTMCQ